MGLVGVGIWNAFVLYKAAYPKKLSFSRFINKCALALIERLNPKEENNASDNGCVHYPIKRKTARCVQCSQDKGAKQASRSTFYCAKCNVALCIQEESTNCWFKWHQNK